MKELFIAIGKLLASVAAIAASVLAFYYSVIKPNFQEAAIVLLWLLVYYVVVEPRLAK